MPKAKIIALLMAGLILGFFIIFPWEQLHSKLVKSIMTYSGQQIQLQSIEGSTGMSLGFKYGSLLGIRIKNFQIKLAQGSFKCDEITLAPKIWPFFIGSSQIGFECDSKDKTFFSGIVKIFPFWSPEWANFEVKFTEFPISSMANPMGIEGFNGNLFGVIDIENFNIKKGGLPQQIAWDLSAQKLVLPSSNSAFFKAPSIDLGEATLKGQMDPSKFVLKDFSFGSTNSPLKGKMKINFGLDTSMLPNSGEWTGELITEEIFEKERLKDINFDLIFGKPQQPGKRRFVKRIRGNYLSLLGPPDQN